MASVLFSDVLKQKHRNHKQFSNPIVRDWWRDAATRTSNASAKRIISGNETGEIGGLPKIGKMFLFQYDPKHKTTLPYYDTYPLVFPIEMYSDGFLGMNMHYLPPIYRARLMDALYTRLNNKRFDESTKLSISYSTLRGVSKMKYFIPTIHRYLYSHVQSKFVNIDADEWDYTLFLPIARWKKATAAKVWNESKDKISW